MKSLDSSMSSNSKKVTEMLEDEIGYISRDSIMVGNDRRVYVVASNPIRPQRPNDSYVKIIKRQDNFIIPEACLKDLSHRVFPYNINELPFEFIKVFLVDVRGRYSEYLPETFEIERLELMENGQSVWIDPYETIHLDKDRNIFLDLDSQISVSRTEYCTIKITKRDGYFLIVGKSIAERIPYHLLSEDIPERIVQAYFLYESGVIPKNKEVLAVWPEYLDDFYVEALSDGETGFISVDSFVLPPKGDLVFISSRGDFSYKPEGDTDIPVTKVGGRLVVDCTVLRETHSLIGRMDINEYFEISDLLLGIYFWDRGETTKIIPQDLIGEAKIDELEDDD